MQSHVQQYYDQGIYSFTFKGLTTHLDKDGIVKKDSIGFPKWKDINKNNFMDYVCNQNRALAVITGKMSNITCVDFDIKEEYERIVSEHPELKTYYTVQTYKGYHIYCKYKEDVLACRLLRSLSEGSP